MSTKATLRKGTATPFQHLFQTGTLNSYDVFVGGEKIGRVFQMRATTMNRYSGRMYGYATERTVWAWESEGGLGGDYELDTRREAVEGLVEAYEDDLAYAQELAARS